MKRFIPLLVVCLALVVFVVPAFAKGKSGPAGNSNKAHLYLYEKDPTTAWSIVEDGAWGKMVYNLSGSEFEYVFNGHGLEAEEEYTLVYYPDFWPVDGLLCLGTEMSNEEGNVNIKNCGVYRQSSI